MLLSTNSSIRRAKSVPFIRAGRKRRGCVMRGWRGALALEEEVTDP